MKSNTIRLAFCTLAAACALPATAATTTADIESTAGLAPVISMTCTPVKFGVWRIPVRSSIHVGTLIMLPPTSDTPVPSGDTLNGVALSTQSGWGAERGKCTLTGSSAPDGTPVMSMVPAGSLAMSPDASSHYSGLSAPATAISGMWAQLMATATTPVISGTAIIYVGGDLSIPNTVTTANYGAYRYVGSVTVTADDQQ